MPSQVGDRSEPFALRAGRWLASFRTAEADPFVEPVRRCVADTLGVMSLGAQTAVTTNTREGVGISFGVGSGPSASVVSGGYLAPAAAALVNGTAAHALDYDDASTIGIGGHASAVIIPAALAIAESIGGSGRQLYESVACGYEIEYAVASVVNPWHYERGFHPTSTLGVIGAAAAAARLLHLDAGEAAMALAMAASMSAGIKANFGSMAKPLHAGLASHGGVLAACLARAGVEASPEVYEQRQGFWDVYGGAASSDGEPALAGDAAGLKIVDPGVGLRKRWPCCGSTHAAIDAAVQLSETVDVSRVAEIRIFLHPRRVPHVDRPSPRTPDEARFSVQHCVTYALAHAGAGSEAFAEQAVADELIATRRARCVLVADERAATDVDGLGAEEFGARLEVELDDGHQLSASVAYPKGSVQNPMSDAELEQKFRECVVGSGHPDPAGAWLLAWESSVAAHVRGLATLDSLASAAQARP